MNKNLVVRITKEFKFEMAHALKGYDGPCRNVHGHSYGLLVTVKGRPITDNGNPKLGMVMDFGDLKKIIKSVVVDVFDHALVLSDEMPDELVSQLRSQFEKVILLPYQPTSELMIADMAERIMEQLPEQIELTYLQLRETVTSYAEWYAADNTII